MLETGRLAPSPFSDGDRPREADHGSNPVCSESASPTSARRHHISHPAAGRAPPRQWMKAIADSTFRGDGEHGCASRPRARPSDLKGVITAGVCTADRVDNTDLSRTGAHLIIPGSRNSPRLSCHPAHRPSRRSRPTSENESAWTSVSPRSAPTGAHFQGCLFPSPPSL